MIQFLGALVGLYSPDGEYEGQGTTEYGLLGVLISVACLILVVILGVLIKNFYNDRINAYLP